MAAATVADYAFLSALTRVGLVAADDALRTRQPRIAVATGGADAADH